MAPHRRETLSTYLITYLRCPQLGLALLVEAAIGGTTIAWVSMSTTLHMQTRRARTKIPTSPLSHAKTAMYTYTTPHVERTRHHTGTNLLLIGYTR